VDGTGTATFTVAPLPAGNHSFTANYAGGAGFEASSSTITVPVAPALLAIRADNQTMVFGSPAPPLTYTPTGFVNGHTATVLSGSPQLSTTATSSANVGTYPITVAAGTLTAANYTFAFVNGMLTITQATPTVTVICPLDIDHDGRHGCRAKVTGVNGRRVRGRITITYNGSERVPFKAGTYTVVASFVSRNPNYTNATGTGTLTIDHDDDDRDRGDGKHDSVR
jgi:hypothetical protein